MSLASLLLPLKRRLRKNNRLYERIAPVFGLYRNGRMAFSRLLHGIDGNLVVFCAFDGRSYNDNPRYISEALHEARPQTDIVWLFQDVERARTQYALPPYVRALEAIGAEGVSALARCRVAVDNFNKRFYLNFPAKGQYYLQTWHGDRPFKKIGYDDPARHSHMLEERCSLVLAGSDFGERVLRSALGYRGPVQKLGCPRNDLLLRNDPAQVEAIRRRLGLGEEERVLLYAPTFRDSAGSGTQNSSLDLNRALDTLERTSGKPWRCLLRAHYYVRELRVSGEGKRLLSVSDYPEMAELLLISDALLTDYSSCAGDFMLLRRPIYLYQDDIGKYVRDDRALYAPMEETPYWVAHDPAELDALIAQTTPEAAARNCEQLLAYDGCRETGHATGAAVSAICSQLDSAAAHRQEVRQA